MASMFSFQALIGLAFSVGFIVGPLAGAWFARSTDVSSGLWGERPAQCALALSLANIALVMFFIPETLAKVGTYTLTLRFPTKSFTKYSALDV